jgi:malic enzyme
LRGADYDALVEEFVQAVKTVFPHALLQWEDFKKGNAFRLMDRYAARLPSFNDDIQGTSGVTLAGVLTGLKITGQALRDQRFLMAGTGAAGVGIGRLVRTALKAEGLSEAEVRARQLYLDSGGLVHTKRPDLEVHKREVAWTPEELAAAGLAKPLPATLEKVVRAFRPTVLIGTTGQPGDFSPEAIRAMASYCERPLILPLSNPTSQAECTPTEALQNSDGRALVATGSPFDPVTYNGTRHVIGQCNNAFVFPGVGLGALISEASRVTNSFFLAAAKTLAEFTCAQSSSGGSLYPSLRHLREVSQLIGFRVAQSARDEGHGRSLDDNAIKEAINKFVWFPDYPKSSRAQEKKAAV